MEIIFKQRKMRSREELLEILAYSIADAGLWTWYAAEFPKYLQLEFNRTLLNFTPKQKGHAPSHQIALQFRGIKSAFIFKTKESKLPENWLELFHGDKLRPFDLDYDQCSFHPKEVQSIMEHTENIEKIFGEDYSKKSSQTPLQFAFKTSETGMIVFADEMKIKTHEGEVPLEKIEEIHQQWWSYWREYWKIRETAKKFPYDDLCEITIPVKN